MLNPFRVLLSALRDLFEEFFLLIGCNLIWAAISLPLWWLALALINVGAFGWGAGVALLGALPAGVASAGLVALAARISDGFAVKLGDFSSGMRRYARPGMAFAGLWMAGLLLIVLNLNFWPSRAGLLGPIMFGAWLYALLTWFSVLIYAPALLVLQPTPSLRSVSRATVMMILGRPVFTLVTVALLGVVFYLSLRFILPLLLFSVALFALWGMRATQAQIAEAHRRREEAATAAAAVGASVVPSEERGRKGQVRPK